MRVFKTVLAALVIAVAACSCSSTSVVKNMHWSDDGVKKPAVFPVLRATGYASISRQNGSTQAIKQVKAMRASKMEAYRELSEQVNGIYIQSENRVNASTTETADSLKTEVDGYVHGARVIRQYALGDTYATELELDTRIIYELYSIRGAL
ncbi:MAG: LPP20 family lipoprotein [Succinivibrio sp.]